MISVRLLGELRERLGCELLQIPLSKVSDTGDLKRLLAQRGAIWEAALKEDQLLLAVNGELRHDLVQLNSGDEVALFPPVTGG